LLVLENLGKHPAGREGFTVVALHSHFTHFPLLNVKPTEHCCNGAHSGFGPAFTQKSSGRIFHLSSTHFATLAFFGGGVGPISLIISSGLGG
jgi:hypothetical protein